MVQSEQNTEYDQFPFTEGDEVLVRVREHGDSGNIVAKFEAECVDISGRSIGAGTPVARFDLPWGRMESTKLKPYEAEFEVQS